MEHLLFLFPNNNGNEGFVRMNNDCVTYLTCLYSEQVNLILISSTDGDRTHDSALKWTAEFR